MVRNALDFHRNEAVQDRSLPARSAMGPLTTRGYFARAA